MTNFILGLIEITLTMSAVIILALIFSKLFGARFSAKCRYIVWALIILRLCIPINLSLLPPLYTYELPSEDFKIEEEINIPVSPSVPDDTPITTSPVVNTPVTSTPAVITPPTTSAPTPPVTPAPPVTVPEPIAPTPSLSVPDILYVIGIVWAAVAALYLAFRLTIHGIYVASLSKSKTLPSPALSAFYSNVCKRMGIKNAPRLYVSASVVSPMLVGFFSPCIIIPDVEFGNTELEGILSHELTHYRRGDLWIKLLSLFSTSLHWFNPFVHIAAARLNQETELSCDEAVLSGSDDEVRRIYGEAVLSVIRRNCHRSIALTTHFNPKKNAVKERFKAILDSTKKRRGRIIIAIALVLCAFAGAILGCSFGKDNSEKSELPKEFNELYNEAEDIYALFTGYGGGDAFEYAGERITYNGYDYDAVSINGITTLEGLRELCKKHFSDEFTEALLSKETAASVPVYIEQDGKLYRFGGYVAPSAPKFPDGIVATLEKIENGVYTVRIDTVGVESGREIPITAYCSYTYKGDEIRFNSFEYTVEAWKSAYFQNEDLYSATDHALKLAKYFGEPITSTNELKEHPNLWEFLAGSVYELHNKGMLTLNMPDKTHYYISYIYMHKAIELYLGIEGGLPDRLLRPEYNWFSDIDTFVYVPFSPTLPVTECVEAKIENGLYLITVRISNSEGAEIALNTYAFEKIHDAEFGYIFRLVGISESSDTINRVLAGTAQMCIDDSVTLLSDWLSDKGFHLTKYAITDLDGNGTDEAVLSLGVGTNDYYGSLVLHTYKGEAFADLLTYRQFMSLKEDGRFSFSSGVANNGVGKLSFENGRCSTLVLARHEDNNYSIGESEVSADEYNKYINEHYQTNDAIWYTVDQSIPAEIAARSYRLSVDVTVSLNIPSNWYRDESLNSQIRLDEAKPFNFISNDYSFFNDTIKRVMIHGDANDFEELKKQLEADTTYKYSFDSPMVGLTDSGYKYEGVYANMTGSRRYIFRISTDKDIYHLEIWEWTAYDSDSFLEDVAIPIVKSFDVIYEDAVVITDIADWDKLPWIEEPKENRKRANNAYNLINDLVSGESNIPEYNELGIKDYSIELLENSTSGTVLSFTFTVKGNSLPETLPPGTYTKILFDGIDVFVYDSYEEYKAHSSDKHNLSSFADNPAVSAVHTYLCWMPYIYEISPHGEWDMSNLHLPYNYISAFYGNESLVIGFEELQKLMLEKFGITVERPAESCYLSRCKYEKETDTVYYADTRGYEPIHRFIDYKAIDGTAYVTVQLYADRNYLLPSHKVTYKIGADEVFLDFEITEQGKYEPNSLR